MTTLTRVLAVTITAISVATHSGAAFAGPPTPTADLQGTLTADRDVVTVGEMFSYTAQAFNAGPDAMKQVFIEFGMPSGATVVSVNASSGACKVADYYIRCDIGTMRAQDNATATLTVTATEPGWTSGGAYVTSHQYFNDPNEYNNGAGDWVYIDAVGPEIIEVACSTTLGATRSGTSWTGNPFACKGDGYVSAPGTATIELLPGATFTGTATVELYRSRYDETEVSFSHSFSRSFVGGIPRSNEGNAVTVDLPAAGFYVLVVTPSAVTTSDSRRVCVPFRPICVGQENYSYTYRSTSHGSFGARVEASS